jgi:protein O-GlcNAc transferase
VSEAPALSQKQEQKPRVQMEDSAAIQAKLRQGLALHQQGRFAEAESILQELVQQDPTSFAAQYQLGMLALQTGRIQRGAELIAKAIELDPNVAVAHNDLGSALSVLKRFKEALTSYDRAIALEPDYTDALYNRGLALDALKRREEALASYGKAITLRPNFAMAYNNRGNTLVGLERFDEALASYDEAIALRPHFAEAHNNRGAALNELNRYAEALASYDQAIALRPHFAEAHNNRGAALNELNRYAEALASCDKAIALMPDYAEAHSNRGVALNELRRFDDALASCDKAIALMPDYADAHYNRGLALAALKRHEDAADSCAEVLKIDPQYPFAKGVVLHQKMQSCDWRNVDALILAIDRDIASGNPSTEPFGWQAVAESQRSLQLCAELYNRQKFPANIGFQMRRPPANDKIIRIGYLSGELREQATSHLIVGVFEHHDHSRFEIYGFDNGWDDKSAIRKRINASMHHVIDISRLGDLSAAAAIRENQIDILVNLNGYFGKHRTRVFAQRPSPIQVNYLGFPGTLGANYIDYVIADQLVVPREHKAFYTEKIAYLPNCYQANDGKKEIGTRPFSRAECGLPQTGFVCCCFNNSYKITPEVFGRWMRILNKIERSVLWLIEDNADAVSNLRKEAAARGVNPERLVFAKRMALPDHLARHRLADLFLDTLPCNAHTTASDALWAGLPVLTQIGETFTGRVAASLLTAIGLPEFITSTPQAYEDLAIELAANPEKLAAIKRRLENNRLTTPLFDTELFTRHIEAAYTAMHERYQAGLSPDDIYV